MFTQTMNNLFIDILDKRVVVFLDGTPIYSKIVEEHFKILKKVFKYLCKHALYYKLKNCSFFQKTTAFLGFNITPKVIHISDAKVRSLKD